MNEKEILKDMSLKLDIETEMMDISSSTKASDSNNKSDSLILKEEPLLKPGINYERQGNCIFLLYNKKGYPLIVIGPHCK